MISKDQYEKAQSVIKQHEAEQAELLRIVNPDCRLEQKRRYVEPWKKRKISVSDLTIGQKVYHNDIYHGREEMEIVGLRKTEVELEGDYSGGTHNVCQRDWLPIKGILLTKNK